MISGGTSDHERAFDMLSGTYDQDLDNWVSRYLRNRSLDLLLEYSHEGSKVLDMGCGTGAEAKVLSDNGRNVSGFDISAGMVAKALRTAPGASIVKGSIKDLTELSEKYHWTDLDMVYSSFGPLNTLPELGRALEDSSRLLKSGGYLIISFMNRYPAMELIALSVNLRSAKLRERTLRVQYVNVSGERVKTYYHSVSDLRSCLPTELKVEKIRALPLFLPPMRVARTGPNGPLKEILLFFDRTLSPVWPLNRFGDHVQAIMMKV